MLKSALPLGLSILALGCASPPHVVVTVPSKQAPIEKRIEAYEAAHGVSKHGLGVPKSQQQDHIDLADGRKVHYPGDLYHAVRRDSDTDYAMYLHDRYRSGSKAIRYMGLSAAVVGAVVAGVGAATADDSSAAVGPIVVGSTAVAGGLAAILVGGGYLDYKADVQRERAFDSYNEDLAKKLGLCIAQNGTPVGCNEETSAPPKPEPAPEAPPAEQQETEEGSDPTADVADAPSGEKPDDDEAENSGDEAADPDAEANDKSGPESSAAETK